MAISEKSIRGKFIIGVIFSCILFFVVALILPPWPNKTKLCGDVQRYLPMAECIKLDDRFAIWDHAFPVGVTSSEDIKSALGEYLQDERKTTYGHLETYYLSVHPIDNLIKYHDTYIFMYDSNGMFLRYSYED